ncbi:MAG: chemotaxis response regulator protein-glutamate methylesterase [Planctomycetota bacterium]
MSRPRPRVLVVDDSAVIRAVVSRVLGGEPDIEVLGAVASGRLALARLARRPADVVTLDVDMPELDGLATLELLRREHPAVRVIMLSALTARGAVTTLDALALGASDYVTKPTAMGSAEAAAEHLRRELVPRIRSLCGCEVGERRPPSPLAPPGAGAPAVGPLAAGPLAAGPGAWRPSVVVLAASTGGPGALDLVLPPLARDLRVPVLVVQHMPPVFTRYFAERLTRKCGVPVREGEGGAPLEPGCIWVAPGGLHMSVVARGGRAELELSDAPPEHGCRPAADVLLRAAADVWGAGVLAVVLTGMGHDGRAGCARVRAAGGRVLAQDEQSSVVWGMPGEVVRAGLADEVLPLPLVAERIQAQLLAGLGPLARSPIE